MRLHETVQLKNRSELRGSKEGEGRGRKGKERGGRKERKKFLNFE